MTESVRDKTAVVGVASYRSGSRNSVRFKALFQINCQPFYLRQLLKLHPFDWLIEIYLQTEGQGTIGVLTTNCIALIFPIIKCGVYHVQFFTHIKIL